MAQPVLSGNHNRPGVSIVTCTKRSNCIDQVFRNYAKQTVAPKELIIILNHDDLDIRRYREKAKRYKNVSIYQLSAGTTLGACLNFAIDKSRFRYVAKFDDDDFYSPYYLEEGMKAFRKTNADIVGKHGHLLYLQGKKVLVVRFAGGENRFVRSVSGATFVIHRRVFRKVRFRNRQVGEDDRFCEDCVKHGFRVYATSRYNFVGIRRPVRSSHTWKISDSNLLSLKSVKVVAHTENFKRYAERRF